MRKYFIYASALVLALAIAFSNPYNLQLVPLVAVYISIYDTNTRDIILVAVLGFISDLVFMEVLGISGFIFVLMHVTLKLIVNRLKRVNLMIVLSLFSFLLIQLWVLYGSFNLYMGRVASLYPYLFDFIFSMLVWLSVATLWHVLYRTKSNNLLNLQ